MAMVSLLLQFVVGSTLILHKYPRLMNLFATNHKVAICENINIAYVDFHIPGWTMYESE